MTIIHRGNDHNVRQQISAALTAIEGNVATLQAGADVYAYKSTDQTAIGTSFADVTGTGLAIAANGVYEFEFCIVADADATTTGIDVACNGPAGVTAVWYVQNYWTSATALATRRASIYDSNTASTDSAGATQAIYSVKGIVRNGANAGTLIARIKREAVGSGPNVRAGSFGRLRKLA